MIREMALAAIIIFIFLAPMVAYAKNEPQAASTSMPEPAAIGSYEVDLTKVVGSTTEERLESFRELINEKIVGKFRVLREQEYAFGIVTYSVVVYADSYDAIADDADKLLGQLFGGIVNLSPDIRYIGIKLVSQAEFQLVFEMVKVDQFRDSARSWREFLEPIAVYGLAPNSLIPVPAPQEQKKLTTIIM